MSKEQMAEKGLLFRLRKEGLAKYGVAPIVAGIYEYQLKTKDTMMQIAQERGKTLVPLAFTKTAL